MFKKLFYYLGIFSTTNAIMIGMGNKNITLFNLLILLIWFVTLMRSKGKIKLYFNDRLYLMFIISIIFSAIVNIGTYDSIWVKSNISKTLVFCILYYSISFLFSQKEKKEYSTYFFKGLYISAVLQLGWEFIQVVLWKVTSISLNQVIFGNILGLQGGRGWTIISNGSFRPTGLGYEPANLAISLVIGYILSSNIYMKILFLVGIMISSSRMGMIVIGVIIFIDVLKNMKSFNKNILRKIRLNTIITIVVFIFIICGVLISNNGIKKFVIENANETIDDIFNFNKTASGATHFLYYTATPELMRMSNVKNIIFGYGFGVSGYPYSKYLNIYTNLNGWNVESDILRVLWGTGVIGFIFYYFWLISIIKNKEYCRKARKVIIAIMISGIFYGYLSSWIIVVQLLAIHVPLNFSEIEKKSVKKLRLKY